MNIFSKIEPGKCEFHLSDFNRVITNFTDVPAEFLQAARSYFDRGVIPCVFCDGGDTFFFLIISAHKTYIFYDQENSIVMDDISIEREDLLDGIISNIEDNLNFFFSWRTDMENYELYLAHLLAKTKIARKKFSSTIVDPLQTNVRTNMPELNNLTVDEMISELSDEDVQHNLYACSAFGYSDISALLDILANSKMQIR